MVVHVGRIFKKFAGGDALELAFEVQPPSAMAVWMIVHLGESASNGRLLRSDSWPPDNQCRASLTSLQGSLDDVKAQCKGMAGSVH